MSDDSLTMMFVANIEAPVPESVCNSFERRQSRANGLP